MGSSPPAKLYSPALLGLAADLALFPFDDALALTAEARSRSCGSVVRLGLTMGSKGEVTRIGTRVSACAIGQASAALLAQSASGAQADSIIATGNALEQWLAGEGALPAWPGLELLTPARDHPGRHGALLLPWKAARMALSSSAVGG